LGRFVAIDYGKARIGLAITDASCIIGQPLSVIKAGKNHLETAHLILKAVSAYSDVESFVLGLPLLLSGKDSEMTLQVREFKCALEQAANLPVVLWDERLTSQQVEKQLKESNMRRKERSQISDAVAAATILQSFLSAREFKRGYNTSGTV
jgi:putative holliday junction resolvase